MRLKDTAGFSDGHHETTAANQLSHLRLHGYSSPTARRWSKRLYRVRWDCSGSWTTGVASWQFAFNYRPSRETIKWPYGLGSQGPTSRARVAPRMAARGKEEAGNDQNHTRKTNMRTFSERPLIANAFHPSFVEVPCANPRTGRYGKTQTHVETIVTPYCSPLPLRHKLPSNQRALSEPNLPLKQTGGEAYSPAEAYDSHTAVI